MDINVRTGPTAPSCYNNNKINRLYKIRNQDLRKKYTKITGIARTISKLKCGHIYRTTDSRGSRRVTKEERKTKFIYQIRFIR